MANFRCERLYVMLDQPVPGLDHIKAIDAVEFAWLGSDDDAVSAGLTPLSDFTFAPFERPRWRPASQGLKTVRGLIELYEGSLEKCSDPDDPRVNSLKTKLSVLAQVQAVLDRADARDRRFFLAAKDLG